MDRTPIGQRTAATYHADRMRGPGYSTERGKIRHARKLAAYVEGKPYRASAFK